ncbi:MAG: hypothetical protein HYW27_02750 [Candidatus Aenigmarchaeota archaeon]|nr:hypothetical protein [Candidatus Aenigmarchaeota archaeon]
MSLLEYVKNVVRENIGVYRESDIHMLAGQVRHHVTRKTGEEPSLYHTISSVTRAIEEGHLTIRDGFLYPLD